MLRLGEIVVWGIIGLGLAQSVALIACVYMLATQ